MSKIDSMFVIGSICEILRQLSCHQLVGRTLANVSPFSLFSGIKVILNGRAQSRTANIAIRARGPLSCHLLSQGIAHTVYMMKIPPFYVSILLGWPSG
jgi:hypothetical protein